MLASWVGWIAAVDLRLEGRSGADVTQDLITVRGHRRPRLYRALMIYRDIIVR